MVGIAGAAKGDLVVSAEIWRGPAEAPRGIVILQPNQSQMFFMKKRERFARGLRRTYTTVRTFDAYRGEAFPAKNSLKLS